jgi:hypothetical protein
MAIGESPVSLVNPSCSIALPRMPFTLRLALGDGQLEYRPFDLAVLEDYRNDPRYIYQSNDISGWISVHDEHYTSAAMREPDKVMLETFGFCYDDDMNRAVAVFGPLSLKNADDPINLSEIFSTLPAVMPLTG